MNDNDNGASGTGDYAPINGFEMSYEVHGEGEPLILLHGGIGAIEMFGEVLPLLARGRQVIGVDLQAHDRTADIDRPMTFEAMADDVAALIEHLGAGEADVMGYSLGGGVALQTAIRHPGAVRKAVLVSTPFERDGWYPGRADPDPTSPPETRARSLYRERELERRQQVIFLTPCSLMPSPTLFVPCENRSRKDR